MFKKKKNVLKIKKKLKNKVIKIIKIFWSKIIKIFVNVIIIQLKYIMFVFLFVSLNCDGFKCWYYNRKVLRCLISLFCFSFSCVPKEEIWLSFRYLLCFLHRDQEKKKKEKNQTGKPVQFGRSGLMRVEMFHNGSNRTVCWVIPNFEIE